MADWLTDAESTLAEAGYRRGGARSAVLEQLAGQSCALTAYEIEAALQERGRTAGRASVYRVLEELHELGLVSRVDVGQDKTLYEAAHAEHHHHHCVCTACGKIVPFDDAPLERAIAALSSRVDFNVTEHDIVLRGLCSRCRG